MKQLIKTTFLAIVALTATACRSTELTKEQNAHFEDAWFLYVENDYDINEVVEAISLLPKDEQRLILTKFSEAEKNPSRKEKINFILNNN